MPEVHTLAAYDIMLYSTTNEGVSRRAIRTNITAATFRIGEPITIVADEARRSENSPGGVDPATIHGIAAEDAVSRSNRMAALEIEDTLRLVELPTADKVFVARYYSADGTGAALTTPTFAAISGAPGNLIYNAAATRWSFDTAAANVNCEGIDVLDANGTRLGDDREISGAGAMVLFRFV
jgi:hypothetical protein